MRNFLRYMKTGLNTQKSAKRKICRHEEGWLTRLHQSRNARNVEILKSVEIARDVEVKLELLSQFVFSSSVELSFNLRKPPRHRSLRLSPSIFEFILGCRKHLIFNKNNFAISLFKQNKRRRATEGNRKLEFW